MGIPSPLSKNLSDDSLDMVMERIDGTDMVQSMTKRPWTIARQGRLLGSSTTVSTIWLPLSGCLTPRLRKGIDSYTSIYIPST